MDKTIKNAAGGVFILTLLVGSYSAFSYARSYSQFTSTSFPALTVTGEGKVAAVPDVAKFSFGVITQGGQDIGALQSQNTVKMNKIIAFIKEKRIKEEDIKTTSYSLNPRQDFDPGTFGSLPRAPEIIGYTIEQNVQVTVRDFSKIGTLLSGAVEAGANSVTNFQFTFDDPLEVENEARTEAFAEAKKKAELIAEAGHFKLGRLLSVDQGGFYPMVSRLAFGGAEMAMDKVVPQIEPGSEDIRVNVTLRYEIRD